MLIRVPQGFILGPPIFLVYIVNLADGLPSNTKFIVDDASLFSVIHNIETSANKLDSNLCIIDNWTFHWKMSFKVERRKQDQ